MPSDEQRSDGAVVTLPLALAYLQDDITAHETCTRGVAVPIDLGHKEVHIDG